MVPLRWVVGTAHVSGITWRKTALRVAEAVVVVVVAAVVWCHLQLSHMVGAREKAAAAAAVVAAVVVAAAATALRFPTFASTCGAECFGLQRPAGHRTRSALQT